LNRTENPPSIAVERLGAIDSTSKHARRLVESGGFGELARCFVAAEQTGGVGRFGRAWASPAGGVWMTLGWPVAPPASAPAVVDGLGLRVGLALARAIDDALSAHQCANESRIKWPNDILIGGRKIAGALCEVVTVDTTTCVLVGVGVNGNFPVVGLPGGLRTASTTLLDEIGERVDLDRLVDDLVARLAGALMGRGISSGALAEIQRRLHGVGERAAVTLPDRSVISGTLLGLAEDGRLRLRSDDGAQITLPSGAELAASR